MVHILEGMQTTGSWRMHVVIDEIESKSTTRCRDKSKGMYVCMYVCMYICTYVCIIAIILLWSCIQVDVHVSKTYVGSRKKTSLNTHKLF